LNYQLDTVADGCHTLTLVTLNVYSPPILGFLMFVGFYSASACYAVAERTTI